MWKNSIQVWIFNINVDRHLIQYASKYLCYEEVYPYIKEIFCVKYTIRWYRIIGNESPPQAPKFLDYKVFKGRSSKEKLYTIWISAAEGGRKSPATPPLVFPKKCLEGGVAGIISPDVWNIVFTMFYPMARVKIWRAYF